jgi:hypothetical protein
MMTIEQARQSVGPDSRLSDSELEQLVAAADVVADLILDVFIDQHRRPREVLSGNTSPTPTQHLDCAA